MYIYYVLFIGFVFIFAIEMVLREKYGLNSKLFSAFCMGFSIFLVMGLRSASVGADTAQYLYRYNFHIYPLDFNIFTIPEWGFNVFSSLIKGLSFSEQGYLLIYAFLVSTFLSRFFYKFSTNIFLSMFLHVTIGIFTLSLSGMRQTLAICINLLAFEFLMKNKLIHFGICVYAAYCFHMSAIIFFPLYFFRNIEINRSKGVLLLGFALSFVFLRTFLVEVTKFLAPEKYVRLYGVYSDLHPVNPLVILAAFLIPFTCLFFWKYQRWSLNNKGKLMSLFFVMSILNLFFNILSLNMNLIGRLSFYFLPFNMVLIPAIISDIRGHLMKILGVMCCLVFPLIQFVISTPGGILRIDKYLFFWQ